MFLVDFYVPTARLVVEINGKDHFYPYTYKKNNTTNFKSKLLREYGKKAPDSKAYPLVNLNVQMLGGLRHEPEKLQGLLRKIILEHLDRE